VENTNIQDASGGITIEDLCTPRLAGVQFGNISADRHIYLDESDAVLASYYREGQNPPFTYHYDPATWDLDAGTHVIATDSCSNDAWLGTSGKVDLIAQAKLNADGTDGNEIVFTPESPTASTADDWGGLSLDHASAGSQLEYIDIGYAANPLFMFYPDSLTRVAHSKIHHFADTGIWVCGAMGQGGMIDSSLVARDAVHQLLGQVGVFLDRADEMDVRWNEIDLSGYLGGEGVGLLTYYGQTECQSQGSENESLLILRNYVKGAGATGGEDVGMRFHWVCGDDYREIEVSSNYVYEWDFAGMEFLQDSDIQVTCNLVTACPRSVHISRDWRPTGPGVRFKDNKVRAFEDEGAVLRTDNSLKTKLGPAWADRGNNRFIKKEFNGAYFIFEDDPGGGEVTLNARQNYWFTDNGQTTTLLTDSTTIRGFVKPSDGMPADADVDVGDPRTDSGGEPICLPGGPGGGGGVARQTPEEELGPEPAGPSQSSGVDRVQEGIPVATHLGKPMPNPTGMVVTLELSVGRDEAGRYDVTVYDVRGRRLARLLSAELDPGFYRLRWSGVDDNGRKASPGIYFIRMTEPGCSASRKAILLR
jgi:hypothetical protein